MCLIIEIIYQLMWSIVFGHLVNMHLKMLNTLSSAIYILEKQTAKLCLKNKFSIQISTQIAKLIAPWSGGQALKSY